MSVIVKQDTNGAKPLLETGELGYDNYPVACWLGKKMDFSRKYGILHLSRGWENQEIIYGLMQGIVFWLAVM